MAWTPEIQTSAEISILLQDIHDLRPHCDMTVCRRVADDAHSMFGPRKQDVDSVGCSKEAAFVLFIASHQRHDYHLGFLALEVVNSGNTECPEKIRPDELFFWLCLRAIAGQPGVIQVFLVLFAQYNGKPVSEPSPEAMQLTQIGRENSNITTAVRALMNQVIHKRSGHLNFIVIPMWSSHGILVWFARFLMPMVQPK